MASAKPPIAIQSTPPRPGGRRGSTGPDLPSSPFFILCALRASVVGNRPAWWRSAPNKPNDAICCGFDPAGHYIWKIGSRGRKTKPIGRLREKPANPKSEARNAKQTQNPNAPNGPTKGVDRMQNKPNSRRFWAENERGEENKANRRGRGHDWGLRIWDWGCKGRWSASRTCGRNAKQSQSATFGYVAVASEAVARDTRCEIRDTRGRCQRRAKQTQFLRFWARNGGASTKQSQSVVGRLPRRCATRNDTTRPILEDAGGGCGRAGRVFLLDYRGRIGDGRRFPQHLRACSARRQAC
jgi:hypothetical protein